MRMIVQRWERSPETSVNILLFAGSRMSVFRLGLSRSEYGRRRDAGLTGRSGIPLAAATLPPLHEMFFHRTLPRCRAP